MVETLLILGIKTLYLICQLIGTWLVKAQKDIRLPVLELLCAVDSAINLNIAHFSFTLGIYEKSQEVNMSGFAGDTVAIATIQLCHCSTKQPPTISKQMSVVVF